MAKKRIIECSVNDEYVVGAGVPIGAAGSHNDVILRLSFGDTWVGLNIYATFRDALGGNPTLVALLPSMLVEGTDMVYDVPIPAAAKLYDGRSMLTLTGYSIVDGSEEDSATNTTTAFFRVLPSDFAFADDGSIDATLAEQLLSAINKHERETGEIIDAHKVEVAAELEEHAAAVSDALVAHQTSVNEAMAVQDEKISEAASDSAAAKDAAQNAVETAGNAVEIATDVKARADAGEFNGEKGDKGDKGDQGKQGVQGLQGVKGERGDPFAVSKIYSSVDEMNAGYASDGVATGSFVIIETGDVENAENARVYVKGESAYIFVTDMSGSRGIQGPQGERGPQGVQGIQGIQGPQGEKGDTGDSYIITDDDKNEIAQIILAELVDGDEVSY